MQDRVCRRDMTILLPSILRAERTKEWRNPTGMAAVDQGGYSMHAIGDGPRSLLGPSSRQKQRGKIKNLITRERPARNLLQNGAQRLKRGNR
jgi:hypothetical protein